MAVNRRARHADTASASAIAAASTGIASARDPAGQRVLPVDRVVVAYNLLLALVWLWCWPREAHAVWMVAAHGVACLLPALLRRWPARLPALPRLARELYPIALIPFLWTEIDLLFPLLHSGTFDRLVAGWEDRLFGVQLAAEWMPRMPQVWFSEVMFFSYFIYYAVTYLPPIALAIGKRTAAARDMVFRLMVGYLSCYLVYLSFPIDGPHFRLEHFSGALQEGFFYQLATTVQASGDSRGCAFPSSHVVGAVTIAFLGWRWLSRPIAILLSVQALGVVCSTVYTQSHYGVDAITGIAWALAVQLFVVPPLLRWLRSPNGYSRSETMTNDEIPVPVLWAGRSGRRRQWVA